MTQGMKVMAREAAETQGRRLTSGSWREGKGVALNRGQCDSAMEVDAQQKSERVGLGLIVRESAQAAGAGAFAATRTARGGR